MADPYFISTNVRIVDAALATFSDVLLDEMRRAIVESQLLL